MNKLMFFRQHDNPEIERLVQIEQAACALLGVIEEEPYRLTSKTFPNAAEAEAALKQLREALNGSNR